MADALIAQIDLQTVMEEGEQILRRSIGNVTRLSGVHFHVLGFVALSRLGRCLPVIHFQQSRNSGLGDVQQVDAQAVFQNQTDHTQGRTAQGKRVFGAGWLFVNRPEA